MATASMMVPRRPRRAAMQVAGKARYPDVCYEREIRNAPLVREPDLAQRRKCCRVFALCAGALPLIFGIVLLHSECVRYGYEISQLKSERAELKEASQQLRLEEARLADPERIDQLARQEFGLGPSEPEQVIRLGGSPAQPALPDGVPVMARNYETLAPVERGIPREP